MAARLIGAEGEMLRGSFYDLLRRLCPYRTRQWFKSQAWFEPLLRIAFGNSVYSKSYYEDVERIEAESVRHIADWIVASLAPRRLMDVGCGPGHLSRALADRGVEVVGVDLSDEAIRKTSQKGIPVSHFDLTKPGALPGAPYDIVLSCEVAEHLEERYAGGFVEKLTNAGETIYLTAAEPEPDQGIGMYHFNEQPNAYWIELMHKSDFELDEDATRDARMLLADTSVIAYLAKPMIFRRRAG
jgi:SAM-dependent methyltransferase